MAREIENLEIVIDVITHTAAIDTLIANLIELQSIAEGIDDIHIKVHVDDTQLNTALAKLFALQGGGGVFGGRGGGFSGMPIGNVSGIAQMDIEDNMVRALDSTNEYLREMVRLQDSTIDALGLIERKGGTGRTVQNMGRGLSQANEAMGALNLRMSDMHNALAKLIPAILVVIGTLPALITALVALAAAAIAAALALGAIGAIGVLGALAARSGTGRPTAEAFQEMMAELTDGILDALLPLGRRFAPLAERALTGVVVLLERVEMVAGRALTGLADDAEAFGRFMMDFIPAAIRNMARMTEAFSGVFGMIADFFNNTGFLQPLTELFAIMLPDLVTFMALLGRLIPSIIKFSVGLLHVLNVVLILFGAFSKLASIVGVNAEALGVLVGTVLMLLTAYALLNSTIVSKLVAALLTKLALIKASIIQYGILGAASHLASAATLGLAGAVKFLTVAIIGLLAATGIGILLSVIGSMVAGFLSTSDAINQATMSLKEFDKVAGHTSGFNPYAPPSGSNRGNAGGRSSFAPTLNVDNRGMDKTDADVQMRNTLWRMRRGI